MRRLVDHFWCFTRQELLNQSTFMLRIIILLQSPSSTKLSSSIRNGIILKNLNVLGVIHNCFQGMISNETLDAIASPYHNLLFVLGNSFDFIAWISSLSTNGVAKQLVTSFISKYRPTAMIIFVFDCQLNTCTLLFLCQHWSTIGQSTLVTH